MEGSGWYGEPHASPSRDSLRLAFGVLSRDSRGLVRLRVFSIFEEANVGENFGSFVSLVSESSRLLESSWSCSCYSSDGANSPTNRWTGTTSWDWERNEGWENPTGVQQKSPSSSFMTRVTSGEIGVPYT